MPRSATRIVSRIAACVGAVGTLVFVLTVGRHNRSLVLVTLFILWDLSPFAALLALLRERKQASPGVSTALCVVTLLLSAATLVVYGDVALGPPRATPAFAFLAVPAVSWLILVVLLLTLRVLRKRASKPMLPRA